MNSLSLSRSSYSALNDFQSISYPPTGSAKRIYFKNLNGIRFFAALLVILSHLEALKNIAGLKNYESVHFFLNSGCIGVVLFFVLSGFLITNILLKEQAEIKTININRFYIRRALRIWPLYFLILFLGSFIFPYIPFLSYTARTVTTDKQFLLYLLLMPNISALFFASLPFLAQLWSIGVEEQFYILWPIIISKTKNLFRSTLKVILIIWVSK
ncbi:MAG TPA: acyltransferase, partial [Flavisolibacter sp.]|nr:acyltransferase [Flavisolibacter sp.]